MNISAPFIRRPVGTALLTAGIALAGIAALRNLPVAPLPRMDFPTIFVAASLPGASPEIMATSVAAPLERRLGLISGVSEMTSTSYLGSTGIVLQFDLSRNIDGAARDVEAAINAARADLPTTLPMNPTYHKVNPAEAPVLILALTSETAKPSRVYDAASTILAQKLSQVQGVGQVLVGGASLPAVRVELNPTALAKYGVGLSAVRNTITNANVNRPRGKFDGSSHRWEITTNGQLFSAKQYEPLIATFRAGAPVKISDLGVVRDSVEDVRNLGLVNGREAVPIILFKQPGANIIETIDRVKALLPELAAEIPGDVRMLNIMDRSITIRDSLHEVERTLVISGLLVILVVFAFLRNVRATLIPTVAVPVSLIGTFGVMYLLGYSIDNLSLMALTIATGFVVDDAIVVLENISRHREQGLSPKEAALIGAREVGFTVLSMSTSLVAVFIPILLMGGILGRMFREFSVTLATAILVSMVISLTTTPMMCAYLLRRERKPAPGSARSGRILERVQRGYAASLARALNYPGTMVLLTFLALAATVILFMIVPKGFFPQSDTGRLIGIILASQDISFQEMKKKVQEIGDSVMRDPSVEHTVVFTGGGQTINNGRIFLSLKEYKKRKRSADQVIADLRRRLASISGVQVFMQSVQDLRVGGRLSGGQYQFTLQGEDLGKLDSWAPQVERLLRKVQQVSDVSSDEQNRGLATSLVIDRSTAGRFGITPAAIDEALYDAFGQRQVAVLYAPLNQYHVVMEVDTRFSSSPAALNSIYLQSADSTPVPLSVFSHYEVKPALLAVNHQGQFPSVTLSFNIPPKTSLSQALAAVQTAIRRSVVPAGMRTGFAGTAQVFQSSLSNEPLLLLAALLAVYVVLGILYESYLHPLTILSTLPSAGAGALFAMLLTGTDFSILGLVGMMLLIGIVKKNGIMMVDFALRGEEQEKLTPREAIYRACLLRFRPIMMTTMAAFFAALPLALGTGPGYEMRRPLGIAIVGGLAVSQALTLYTTPAIYLFVDRLRNRLRKRLAGRQVDRRESPPPPRYKGGFWRSNRE